MSAFAAEAFVCGNLCDDRDDDHGSHQYPEKICVHNVVFYVMRQEWQEVFQCGSYDLNANLCQDRSWRICPSSLKIDAPHANLVISTSLS